MEILFITRCFYPHGDATSTVVYNLAKELLNNGNKVKVLSLTSFEEDQIIDNVDGIETIKYYAPETKNKLQLKEELRRKPIRTGLIIAKKVIDEVESKICKEYKQLSLNPAIAKAYKKAFTEHKSKLKFDVCIITMMPHEAIWANKVVHFSDDYVLYQLDTYWNNSSYPASCEKHRMAFEFDLIKSSMFTLTTPIICRESGKVDNTLKRKMVSAEFPMVIKPVINKEHYFSDGKKHIVFLGTLYPELRPPEKLVSLLSMINSDEFCFDFYGTGQEYIERSPDYEKARGIICLHGLVPSREAKIIRESADVLVNIDNTTLLQVPSKVFEYICTGKPVINCYFLEDSPSLGYLKKYSNCFNINLSKAIDKEKCNALQAFIKSNSDTPIPFETIKQDFESCTPGFVAKQLLDGIRKIKGKDQLHV